MKELSQKEKKLTGSHFTPANLSDFVASRILSSKLKAPKNVELKVLDPAVGDGQLLKSFIRKFENRGRLSVQGYDTNQKAISYAKEGLKKLDPYKLILKKQDFLSLIVEQSRKDLFSNNELKLVDYVIANPPYVRTQNLGSKRSQKIAKNFNLSGRVDIYHAFIKGIGEILKPGGLTGLIVSNRFMSTKSGESIRKSIRDDFDILEVWDFGDTKIFEAAVLPAVLILRKKNGSKTTNSAPDMTTIYSTTEKASRSGKLFSVLDTPGIVDIGNSDNYKISKGKLYLANKHDAVWRLVNKDITDWLKLVKKNTYCHFSDIGKIRVGVKTTADKVFIRDDWENLEECFIPEILKPVTTHKRARRFKPIQDGKTKILYTHTKHNGNRKVIELEKFPKTKNYLESHKERLASRNYVIEAGREWFEIWVPQEPDVWDKTKIVFRDISEKPTFWMDKEGTIVNGDCYWFTSNNEELLWLSLAIANSDFIEIFYDYKFNNKLYSGRRRYITQYVKRFPLPDPSRSNVQKIISLCKQIYNKIPTEDTTHLEFQLNKLVWQVFGFNKKVVG